MIAVFVLAGAAGILQHARSQTAGVLSSATTDVRNLRLGEPVVVEWTLTNTTPDIIEVDLGANSRENIVVTVSTPDRRVLVAPQLRMPGYAGNGNVTLGPGESMTKLLVLNRWMRFDQIGPYDIQVGLATPPYRKRDKASLVIAANAKVQVEFFLRDIGVLRARYKQLLSKLMSAASYEESETYASALALTNDDVVVPYLEEALQSKKMVESIALEGLSTIGSSEAVQILGEHINDEYRFIGAQARAALQQIQAKTADQKVKHQITRLLAATK